MKIPNVMLFGVLVVILLVGAFQISVVAGPVYCATVSCNVSDYTFPLQCSVVCRKPDGVIVHIFPPGTQIGHDACCYGTWNSWCNQ